MEITEVDYQSPEYQEALALRHAVLREPLGLEWTAEELEGEKGDRYFCLVEAGGVAACLSVRMSGGKEAKIRQMAVQAERHGQGFGRRLVSEVVGKLSEEGVARVFLHSREAVTGFYEALGFHKIGERFEEVGLAHWCMELQTGAEAR